jgi:hypothetical protein
LVRADVERRRYARCAVRAGFALFLSEFELFLHGGRDSCMILCQREGRKVAGAVMHARGSGVYCDEISEGER